MEYYVYIVRCADDSLYTGIAKDIDKRIHEHNHLKSGAKYCKAHRPVSEEYREGPYTKSEALSREAAIKSLTRTQKLDLIKS